MIEEIKRPDIEDRTDYYPADDKEGIIPTSIVSDPAAVTEMPADKLPDDVNEYGYGFWFRFLTMYPVKLMSGKNAPWYFLARLTSNIPHADIGMGDRILAIW